MHKLMFLLSLLMLASCEPSYDESVSITGASRDELLSRLDSLGVEYKVDAQKVWYSSKDGELVSDFALDVFEVPSQPDIGFTFNNHKHLNEFRAFIEAEKLKPVFSIEGLSVNWTKENEKVGRGALYKFLLEQQ
ncbi:hypothetical protein LRP49_04315 [Enterovibrio sp. ZSDZ35]|uniref:Lipoprotein n=1 Tax=Enterovibrio qingdaonensis TaxID=2899818 RepID=A0ABT5QIW7_9GAMM|nr:hypothetical protein [Enterovibrio sp. ZSDZ35]MDD1780420.1 hypothetical protein [Enterovibrio sp. ZSDZ35]